MYEFPEPRGRRWMPIITGILAGLAVAALALTLFLVFQAPRLLRLEAARAIEAEAAAVAASLPSGYSGDSGIADSRNNAIVAAVEKVGPAVVSIMGTSVERYTTRPRSVFDFFEFFGRPRIEEREVPVMGSGVLVSPYGRVVTNHHVIEGAEKLRVTLSDGNSFPAHLLDSSVKHDIALLELELPEEMLLPYAELGDSDDLRIGEWAIAIGSPFGFQLNDIRPSVTVGVISATHREVRAGQEGLYTDMIQTDAAINPGNSGGPLVSSEGKVIGINTLIFSKDGTSLGIGFARPVNKLVWVLNEFEKYGKVRDTWAGLEAMNLQPFHIQHYELKANNGIFVTKVFKGGPAATAGILPGDVITEIGGDVVSNIDEANLYFFRYEVGDRVRLTVDREGRNLDIGIDLEAYSETKSR